MYCLSCGASLPEDALSCLKCGKLTPRGMSDSTESANAPTLAATSLPSDPYSSQPSTRYGPQPAETDMPGPYAPPSPYTPPTPPPPPPSGHSRSSSGFLKGLLCGMLIILLSVGISTFLLLRQATLSPSAPSTVKTTATSHPTTPTVAPTATPAPTVLYQADWSTGLDGWVGSPDWKVQNGMLVSDGTNQPSAAAGPTILAPYQLTASGNFAIEIKLQAPTDGNFDPLLFHGSATANGWQGYKLTVCGGCKDLRITSDDFNDVQGKASFDPGTTWHTYRVEVRGPAMTVIVDGTTLFTANDSRFSSGEQVGIKSSTQLMVSSFKITSL